MLTLWTPQVAEWYHVIIFTASVQAYGDPVIDMLDRDGHVKERFFRHVRRRRPPVCAFTHAALAVLLVVAGCAACGCRAASIAAATLSRTWPCCSATCRK